MQVNIHKFERIARVVLGIGFVSQAFIGLENKWFLLGIVPLLTGAIGWCPPYAMLGINTCKLGKQD